MKDHIRGDEGTVEDEGGDVDEPLPGFESLPPDAEREVDGHRETGTTHEEDKKREDFRGRKRHRYMYRLGSVGTYRSFVNCFGYSAEWQLQTGTGRTVCREEVPLYHLVGNES